MGAEPGTILHEHPIALFAMLPRQLQVQHSDRRLLRGQGTVHLDFGTAAVKFL
jgi:hypothetical protein